MKKRDVNIGEVYLAKVSSRVVPVRILGPANGRGWIAVNLVTGREIHIRSGKRLRGPAIRRADS